MDDLRQAAYTSPTGVRCVFDYEDVARSVDKKTSGHNFPDVDGTYVQDTGHTGRQYPVKMFIWGKDYATRADEMEAALMERGMGKLEHPVYGVFNVVPYGTISRNDGLVNEGNQATIDVTFWETLELVYPSPQTDPAAEVFGAVEAINTSMVLTNLTNAVGKAQYIANFTALLDRAGAVLWPIANSVVSVSKTFGGILDSIKTNIIDPVNVTIQTLRLFQAAARSLAPGRQDAFAGLLEEITSQPLTKPEQYPPREIFATGYITGTIVTLVNTQYATKAQAVAAADELLTQFDTFVAWRDDNNPALDTGESYQKLQQAVALTAGYLVQISFSLKTERKITLGRARTIIDLSAEIYGVVDDKLDFLIASNNLSGNEILELPAGRKIVYYT